MKVFKFGGASVNSVDRIKKLGDILKLFPGEKILIIVSAMGKTTNDLEKVAEAFYNGKKEEALLLFSRVKEQHTGTAKNLLVTHFSTCTAQLQNFFTEAEWLLHEQPVRAFDYYYDQVVCTGELLSTALISAYLEETGIINRWMDVRDVIRTDDNFREANILWETTAEKVRNTVLPLFDHRNIVITQGFIGATDENESTTLGREGSDYTGAVFANMMDAGSLTIWKDVSGVMSADPRQFPGACLMPKLSYTEVTEMAYYGAQVIHPKTIKPLQNKKIPLYVKCFLDPLLPGTAITGEVPEKLPPVIVIKENQVMMEMKSKDFSFVGEKAIGRMYHLFEKLKIKPNLTQNGAITFLAIMDNHPDKIEKLTLESAEIFSVQQTKPLTLLTIRHYDTATFEKLTEGKTILLRQQTPETIQVLLQNNRLFTPR